MALIHTTIATNSYAILNRIQPEESDQDFDRAGMDILFRGTDAQLRAAFPKGSESNYPGSLPAGGGMMVCAGVKVSRSRFGFIWARVEWVGLLKLAGSEGGLEFIATANFSGTLAVRAITFTETRKQLNLPVNVDGIGTITAAAPYNATGALARSRTTIYMPEVGKDYQLVMIVNRTAPVQRPKLISNQRPPGLPTKFNNATAAQIGELAVSKSNWFEGINTANSNGGGWCPADFQSVSSIILGTWLLCRASVKFQWIDRFTAD